MNRHPVKNEGLKSLRLAGAARAVPGIPIEFFLDSPRTLSIKIQPPKIMHSDAPSDKPLIPALFQIAARADELQSLSAMRNALHADRASRAEIMLSAEKLDAVLKSIAARKKKPVARRISPENFEGRISASDSPVA